MNISISLSVLKVIDKGMKLLKDIKVHMYVCYHYTYNIIVNLLYDDYAGILEYPVSLPLVDW